MKDKHYTLSMKTTTRETIIVCFAILFPGGRAITKAQRDINRKLRVLSYAGQIGNISKTCRHFGISGQTFYEWKQAYAEKGEAGLINSKPCPENPTL